MVEVTLFHAFNLITNKKLISYLQIFKYILVKIVKKLSMVDNPLFIILRSEHSIPCFSDVDK